MPPLRPHADESLWRGLPEPEGLPSGVRGELAALLPDGLPEASRRRFLKLMGASLALASAAGCHRNNPTWPRWPQANILPHAHRPEGHDPGRPLYYATMMEIAGVARPVLAKSYDGRPIKIEGNPEHPASRGAADVLTQASILEMYDPERSRGVARVNEGEFHAAAWEDFVAEAGGAFAAARRREGRGLRVLAEESSSPALARMRSRLTREMPQARWHEWEPLSRDEERAGTRAVFGASVRPQYRLDQARVVVSLDDDFLGTHPNAVAYARDFAAQRRADDGHMSRLFVVESTFSLTGSNADVRVALPCGRIGEFAWTLAGHLVRDERLQLPSGFDELERRLRDATGHGEELPEARRIARELAGTRGRALITVGPAQPAGLHALVHVLNAALDATGHTVDYLDDPAGDRPAHVESLRELVRAMSAGEVEALLILGGNPVYDAPADLGFEAAMAGVRERVHLSLFRNETSQACRWHVPRAHYLEAWGDALTWDGTYTLAQPLIRPMFDGATSAEMMSWVLDGAITPGDELTRAACREQTGRSDVRDWRRATHDGFVPRPETRPAARFPRAGNGVPDPADFTWSEPGAGTLEVVFRPDPKVWDGRFFGNPWLQELPDPMTKLTWDNAAQMSPRTARDLGVGMGDLLRLTHGDRTLEVPVFLMPGQAPGSVTVTLGYGRFFEGRMAERDSGDRPLGFNAYSLRTAGALGFAAAVDVARAGGRHELVTTQHHHAIHGVDNRRQISGQAERLPALVREASLTHYREHPDFARHEVHHPPLESLWSEHGYDEGHRWGMSIDLSVCNGCSACVIACQAENNIPVTGKEEVSRGREMHWIRVDRYFRGDAESPQVAHQPVTCHHCENAPCEQVCPVAATMHSREGLNDMIYNRCVGTRYCLNNCPYKVRRFNWFNNQSHESETTRMQYNPDVTIRSRGVMEKCTYCVQRIKAATIPAKNEGREVRDGEIVPACAQTCPTNAIVFGDLNDPESRVRKMHDHPRAYAMLAELNVKPRTNYLAKIRNEDGDGSDRDGHGAGHASAPPPSVPRG